MRVAGAVPLAAGLGHCLGEGAALGTTQQQQQHRAPASPCPLHRSCSATSTLKSPAWDGAGRAAVCSPSVLCKCHPRAAWLPDPKASIEQGCSTCRGRQQSPLAVGVQCHGTKASPRAEPGLRSLEVVAKASHVRCDQRGKSVPTLWPAHGTCSGAGSGHPAPKGGCESWKHSAEPAAWLLVQLQELALSPSRVLALSDAFPYLARPRRAPKGTRLTV